MGGAREAVAAAVARLAAVGARTERRVELVAGRGLRRGSWSVASRGPVWRLGALCLDAEGRLYATGQVLVVASPAHPNFRSSVALERQEFSRLAARAGIPVGTAIVVDAPELDLEAGSLEAPLVATAQGVGVAWAPGAVATPLPEYLAERVELLIAPPAVG